VDQGAVRTLPHEGSDGAFRSGPMYEHLRGAVAFYPGRVDGATVDGEQATPQPGGFYGGWITAEIAGPVKGGPGSLGW
jgi:hypothetical protein